MKYSDPCVVSNRTFRYDYENCLVESVLKADEEMLKDNEEWNAKFGKDLWEIDEDGYVVEDTVGLSVEHWDNKESRIEYLTEWAEELKEEANRIMQEYLIYG